MAPSEAQKKAANKYNKTHMATLACKVKKEEAAKFKAYSAKQGKTANTMLKNYVISCITDSKLLQDDSILEKTSPLVEKKHPSDN